MATTNWNEQNFFLQMQVQRLEQERADLNGELWKLVIALGASKDELKEKNTLIKALKAEVKLLRNRPSAG